MPPTILQEDPIPRGANLHQSIRRIRLFLDYLKNLKPESLTPYDKKKTIKKLEQEMKRQAEELNFELAIKIREKVKQLNG